MSKVLTVKNFEYIVNNIMKWRKRLEASNEETDIGQIFTELRERGIEVEKDGNKISYNGKQFDFTITEDQVEYTLLTGINTDKELEALAYIQRNLKLDHGYTQKDTEVGDADPEIRMNYHFEEA